MFNVNDRGADRQLRKVANDLLGVNYATARFGSGIGLAGAQHVGFADHYSVFQPHSFIELTNGQAVFVGP